MSNIKFINYAQIYFNKGLCYLYLQNFLQAEDNFRRALLSNEDILGDKNFTELKSNVYQNMGVLYELKNNFEYALENYQKSLKIKYFKRNYTKK